jgi:hypothetical protein
MPQVSAPRHRLLTLDDAQMIQLLKNPNIVARFPFMRAASQQVTAGHKAGCLVCGSPVAQSQPVVELSGIRAAIDSMSQVDKDALKVILSADRIRLYYKDHRNESHKSTF